MGDFIGQYWVWIVIGIIAFAFLSKRNSGYNQGQGGQGYNGQGGPVQGPRNMFRGRQGGMQQPPYQNQGNNTGMMNSQQSPYQGQGQGSHYPNLPNQGQNNNQYPGQGPY